MSKNLTTEQIVAIATEAAVAAVQAALIAAPVDLAETVTEAAPERVQAKTRTRKDKPINRTNREAVVRAMTREGWEGHEHMSAKALVELLREAGDCPKGFYLPTGAVKDAIAAAKNA